MNNLVKMSPEPIGQQGAGQLAFGGVGGNALRTLIRLLMKRRLVAGAVIAAALVIGIAFIIFSTALYRASATLEISREVTPVVDTGERASPVSIDLEFYETQYGLLRGTALARDVVRRLNLSKNPNFVPLDKGLSPGDLERIATEKLKDNTQIVPQRQSRLVDVRIVDASPALAADMSNALSESYIRQNLEKRINRTAYARQFLDDRIRQVRKSLEDSERRLVAYARSQQIISVPNSREGDQAASSTASQSLTGSNLAGTSEALIVARAARAEAQARWEAASAAGARRSEILQNPAVTTLLAQRAQLQGEASQLAANFDETSPQLLAKRAQIVQMSRQIKAIENDISASLKSEYEAAVKRENDLVRQVDTLKSSVLDLSNRSIGYTFLQREVDTNRALYEGLLQQYKQVNVASDIGSNNVNFVLRADPPKEKDSPKTVRIMLIALLLGIVVAIAAALGLEILDARITTPEDFRERLEMPLIGIIPATDDPIEDLKNPRSPVSEAYSSTHANLKFTSAEGAPKILAVSSTRAGEGKTTTSIAIASIFARRGDRVVVIDGDLRRPSLHRRLDLDNSTGFSNLLSGDSAESISVNSFPEAGIDVITSGPMPPNPADLLASTRLSEVLQTLREQYDRVIVDAPPVLGLVDAPLIAGASEGVIFVVEAGGPRLGPVRRACERISDLQGKIVGFVFTKYMARNSMFDEYGSYEYYSYGNKPKAD